MTTPALWERQMSLASEVKVLIEEIKAKQADWLALSVKADDEKRALTLDEKESLSSGNKALSDLVDKKVALETQITEQTELKATLDKMNAADKAKDEAEQEATEKARSSAQAEQDAKETWVDGAVKAFKEGNPSKEAPYKIGQSLKVLFAETLTGTSQPGYVPDITRDSGLVAATVRPNQFFNTLRQIPVNKNSVEYDFELPITDPSIEVAEGGTGGEATFQVIQMVAQVRGVMEWIPVSNWILDDDEGQRDYLQTRLTSSLMRGVDNAVLNWTGATNQFTGVLSQVYPSAAPVPTALQGQGLPTFAKVSGESLQVAVSRGVESINGPFVSGYSPTGGGGQANADIIYVTVQTYWDWVRQQDALGNFMVTTGLREAPQLRCAGLPVVQCQVLPVGNILVMDRMYTMIRDRQDITMYWDKRMAVASNLTQPTLQQTLAADARLTVVVQKMDSTCLITGA